MGNKYKVERIDYNQIEKVVQLYRTCFGRVSSVDFFKWKYGSTLSIVSIFDTDECTNGMMDVGWSDHILHLLQGKTAAISLDRHNLDIRY